MDHDFWNSNNSCIGVAMNKIVETSYRVLRGTIKVPKRPGYCLAFVRSVVEQAFDLPPHTFYSKWVDPNFHLVANEVFGSDIHPRWARGAERAFRAAKLTVPIEEMQPGDLLFSYKVSKPYGHVGILLPGKLVLENTTADRGWRQPNSGAVRLTPLRQWSPVTTVVRLKGGE